MFKEADAGFEVDDGPGVDDRFGPDETVEAALPDENVLLNNTTVEVD